jgi:alpha,alpha-trehalase
MKLRELIPFWVIVSVPLVVVDAPLQLERLLRQADTDHDRKITIDDSRPKFWLEDLKGGRLEVSGTYPLSNLLQELKLATDTGGPGAGDGGRSAAIRTDRVFEGPVDRVSRSIRERYWDNLTRRVDADHLAQVLPDSKIDSKLPKGAWRYLYVPADDESAFRHFEQAALVHPELRFKVERLPPSGEVNAHHGLLALGLRGSEGVPYVVPGGRFNEMYGWDSYFESLGLLADGRVDLARAMVDNFVYQIEHYGKILNANRTYYLNRSQPPFLTAMISAVYERLDRGQKSDEAKSWLRRSLQAAVREYFTVWLGPDRLTATGLSRYYGSGHGIPPEVEKGHFDYVLRPAARRLKMTVPELEKRYNSGEVRDAELDDFFAQDRAVRESGHDTTYRWRVDGKDRAADFVTVDLNSLLYRYELDLARLIRRELGGTLEAGSAGAAIAGVPASTTADDWKQRARNRRELILKYMWDPETKLFYDYNFKGGFRSRYVSATAFYPLWAESAAEAGDEGARFLGNADAKALIDGLLAALEAPGGLAATSRASLNSVNSVNSLGSVRASIPRQWDYPNGWAPHQMMAWTALRSRGRERDALRLSYKWLYSITRNAADYNGTVPEKMDVERRSHAVFAEYGNVGTRFSYITQEGFGWMNASYQTGLEWLGTQNPVWRERLQSLIPPEWLDFQAP